VVSSTVAFGYAALWMAASLLTGRMSRSGPVSAASSTRAAPPGG
jgi:hypothetical protein